MHVEVPKYFGDAKALPHCDGGVANAPVMRYSPMCCILSTFVTLGQTVWVQVGGPKNLWRCLGHAPRDWGVTVSPKTHYSPTYYHNKFHRSRSNRFGICRRSNFFFWGGDAWAPIPKGQDVTDPLKICFSPPVLPYHILSL